ncbi:MAG: hypothetical protein Q8L55_03315 [Phycisphaerales bacterium]|nr:hypothetical protein [Phycisphaerales bacterium]
MQSIALLRCCDSQQRVTQQARLTPRATDAALRWSVQREKSSAAGATLPLTVPPVRAALVSNATSGAG